jgi:hypothetical protein
MNGLFPRFPEQNPFKRIRHIPGQPVSYLQNPKVGSKSIELSLWRKHDDANAPGNPHERGPKPFLRFIKDLDKPQLRDLSLSQFFSVVRNPYSRFLSAYLSKVMMRPWKKLSTKFGFDPESPPTINELLASIRDRDPYAVDHHFRPQHINLLRGFAPLDFLGYFEKFDDVKRFLEAHGFNLESNTKNSTNATEKVSQLLNSNAIQAIQSYYALDFEKFGYSPDPQIAEPANSVHFDSRADRARMRAYFQRRMDTRKKLLAADGRAGRGAKF